jgi:hypothetical protein
MNHKITVYTKTAITVRHIRLVRAMQAAQGMGLAKMVWSTPIDVTYETVFVNGIDAMNWYNVFNKFQTALANGQVK